MARLSKCKVCGEEIQQDENRVKIGNYYYHEKCSIEIQRENESRKKLIAYICTNFEISSPTGMMLKQLKTYREVSNYSYDAMTYTLWYVKEILNKKFDMKYGLSIIGYYYEEAKRYCEEQLRLSNKAKGLKDVDIELKTRVITRKNSMKNEEKSRLIDLEKLLNK